MLKLKEVLASLGKPQTDLARAVDLSPAAIAQLINHSQWPKSLDQQQLAWRITEYLMAQGAQFDTVRQAFDEVGAPPPPPPGPPPSARKSMPSGRRMLSRVTRAASNSP
ncbi:transposase, partial [Pseudomonas aeruginosa]|nr:transposase [Pseudomonas aeruginosa]